MEEKWKKPKNRESRSKSKKNDKKLLQKPFDKWKKNASFRPTRNVLDRIKNNKLQILNDDEKNDLLKKYKNKVLVILLNIYKRQRNLLLKNI